MAPSGRADLIVQRDDMRSQPVRFTIGAANPSLLAKDSAGTGELDVSATGHTISFRTGGLGPTDPPVADGDVAPSAAARAPAATITAVVGGMPMPFSAVASVTNPAEFTATVDLPASARPGDVVNVLAMDSLSGHAANPLTWQHLDAPEFTLHGLASSAPQAVYLSTPDWNGNLAFINGSPDSRGCYPAMFDDTARRVAYQISQCITGPAGSSNPAIVAANGVSMLAVVGTYLASPQLLLFSPTLPGPHLITLPTKAIAVSGSSDGNYLATLDDGRGAQIDGQTGHVTLLPAANTGTEPAKLDGMVPISALAATTELLTKVYADDRLNPSAAEFVVFDRQANIQATALFPQGWVPLVVAPALKTGNPGLDAITYRSEQRTVYALAQDTTGSRHALVTLSLQDYSVGVIPFPDGVYVATCTLTVRMFAPVTQPDLVLFGRHIADRNATSSCIALGYIVVDLNRQAVTYISQPAGSRLNIANSQTGMMNDYIYAGNFDPTHSNKADTLYVFDCANLFTMALAVSSGTFTTLSTVPEMNTLTALIGGGTPGDGGVAIFDLDAGAANVIPLPDGADRTLAAAIYPITRKLAATVSIPAAQEVQLALYDLATGQWTVYANPAGVGYVGLSAQTAHFATHANILTAVSYTKGGKQSGILVVRIP
jgi:hypothetical protein